MATCVSVAGGIYPTTYNGNDITPMEGVSLFTTLAGEADTMRLLTFEHQGTPAIRKGDWKLFSCKRNSMNSTEFTDDTDFELYNIADDRSETTNMAAIHPEKVTEFKQLMFEEFYRTLVFPKQKKNTYIVKDNTANTFYT